MYSMKRLFFYLGTVLFAAAVGATTAGALLSTSTSSSHNPTPAGDIEHRNPFRENAVTDAHFASTVVSTEFPDLTYAAENAVKAVVNIESRRSISAPQYRDPFYEFFGYPDGYNEGGSRREARAGGSGVIISEDGYIVTNNHVVEQSTKLRVTLHDGRTFDAKIVGTDPTTDVALIKIEATGLPTLPFGSSDELRLGEWVLAIGYPMELQSTITAGIVSAKARRLGALDNGYGIESYIQTDAAVNPGNSGGALVNTRGELVGINTIIKTSTGSYVGYSFAVPETIVRKVVVDLKESGIVQRAVLGISFREVDQLFLDEMGEITGIETLGGMYVASVTEGGAASEAGIRKGDVILSIDGTDVSDTAIFLEQISKRRPGDNVTLTVRRGAKQLDITVTLKNKAGDTSLLTADDKDIATELGGRFATASASVCQKLDIEGGVQITKITRGGLLERARIAEGFIITHINDRAVRSIEELNRLTGKIRSIDGVYPNGRASSYVIVE